MKKDELSGLEKKIPPTKWLQTYTGKMFWIEQPSPDMVSEKDIAHALSMQCRFNGHCHKFLSVAEHLIMCAAVAPYEYKLEALMHDAPEAYCSDLPRPVKNAVGKPYYDIEDGIAQAVAARYGLVYYWPDIIKEIDNRMLITERNQNMGDSPAGKGNGWPDQFEPYGIELQFYPPAQAEAAFLALFYRLMRNRGLD